MTDDELNELERLRRERDEVWDLFVALDPGGTAVRGREACDSSASYFRALNAYRDALDAAAPKLVAEVRRLRGEVHDCPGCGEACKRCRCVDAEIARMQAIIDDLKRAREALGHEGY